MNAKRIILLTVKTTTPRRPCVVVRMLFFAKSQNILKLCFIWFYFTVAPQKAYKTCQKPYKISVGLGNKVIG